MILGSPIWIWLCTAMVIPILIHLWNKKSGRPQLLGTFRFLPKEDFSKARSLQLHEVPLLLVRIGIITTIAALLTGIFLKVEKPIISQIQLIQTDAHSSEEEIEENGSLKKEVSQKEVASIGWWNIISQVEHDFNPQQVIVKGDFNLENFNKERVANSIVLDWIPSQEMIQNEYISEPWKGEDGSIFQFVQTSSETGFESRIESVSSAADTSDLDEVKISINDQLHKRIKDGIIYTANRWNFVIEEEQLSDVVRIEVNDNVWLLKHFQEEDGGEGFIAANAISGISFKSRNMNLSPSLDTIFLKGRTNEIPFFGKKDNQTFIVNGHIEEELESWVYAGITNQMILDVLEVEEGFLSPQIPESQRELSLTTSGSGSEKRNQAEQKDGRAGLLGILLLLWIIERWLAPKKGM